MEDWNKVREDFLTPQWIKELDEKLKPFLAGADEHKLAGLIGTLIGLLDYARGSCSNEDWDYILSQLDKYLEEH